MRTSGNSRRSAFTLVEMLLVIVIIGILAGAVAVGLGGRSQQARITRAQSDMASTLSVALDLFEQDVGRYPTSGEGLAMLLSNGTSGVAGWRGPYIKGTSLANDPWGNPYQYSWDSENNRYTLSSSGPDGESGTGDDVSVVR